MRCLQDRLPIIVYQVTKSEILMTERFLAEVKTYLGRWASLHIEGLEQHLDTRLTRNDQGGVTLNHGNIDTTVIKFLTDIVGYIASSETITSQWKLSE